MGNENVVICGANSYEGKYYLNQDFSAMPQSVKDELQIMCVLYVQDVGGILTLELDEEGHTQFRTRAAENDFSYDEIGSVLKIRQLQREKEELLQSLELFYRLMVRGKKTC